MKRKLRQILKEETGLGEDGFFMELEESEDLDDDTEDDDFDEETEEDLLAEMLGLDSDYTREDFLDAYDP